MYNFMPLDNTDISIRLLIQKILDEVGGEFKKDNWWGNYLEQEKKFENLFKELLPSDYSETKKIHDYYRKLTSFKRDVYEDFIIWSIIYAADQKINSGYPKEKASEATIHLAKKLEEKDKNTRVFYELDALCEQYRKHLEEPLLKRLELKDTSELDDYIKKIDLEGAAPDIKKYSIVKNLQQSIKSEDTPQNRLDTFSKILQENEEFLSKHRDSTLIRFLKGVAVIFAAITTAVLIIPAFIADCAGEGERFEGVPHAPNELTNETKAITSNAIARFNVKGQQFGEKAKKILKEINTDSNSNTGAPSPNKPK